jgi:hypothetical protein
MNSKGRKEKIRKINTLKCRGGYFITWGENIIVFGIMKRLHDTATEATCLSQIRRNFTV